MESEDSLESRKIWAPGSDLNQVKSNPNPATGKIIHLSTPSTLSLVIFSAITKAGHKTRHKQLVNNPCKEPSYITHEEVSHVWMC